MRKKYPRIVRALLVLALVVSLTGVLAVVPVSAQAPDIDLSASQGAVGSSLTITVNNFQVDSIVTVTFDGVPVATAPTVVEVETDPDTFSIKVPIAAAGTHAITVTNGPETDTEYFEVVPKVAVTSPASKKGPVGSAATVEGTGFAAGFTVKVTVGDVPFASGISDNTGSVTITGMIPGGLAAGGQTVAAEDLAGNPTSAANEDTFTVTPSLAVSPANGLAGSKVTITGSGWGAGNVVLQFAGGPWVTAVASATGIINMAGVETPPSAAPGVTEVRGTQGLNVATASFTVDARPLIITPNKGPMGTTVLLQADKMTPGPAGNVPLNGLVIGATEWNTGAASSPDGVNFYPFPQPGAINIGTAGQLFPTTAYVPPNLTVGTQTVVVIDSDGLIAGGLFEVTRPTLTASPTTGPVGSTVTIQGTGWVPNSQITLAFGGSQMTVMADANGNIAAAMTVPAGATAGPNKITANDPVYTNAAAPATFTVPGAYISLDKDEGSPGDSVTVTGSGFQGYAAIQVSFGGYTFPGVVLASPLGDFSMSATVPGVAPGAAVVAAIVGGNPVATTYFVVKKAPVTVQTVMAQIMDVLDIVWGYVEKDAVLDWYFFDPDDPEGSAGPEGLPGLEPGKGYWVKVSEATVLVYGGHQYVLLAGWTNIGWLGI
jgi:hypothetical protein